MIYRNNTTKETFIKINNTKDDSLISTLSNIIKVDNNIICININEEINLLEVEVYKEDTDTPFYVGLFDVYLFNMIQIALNDLNNKVFLQQMKENK